MSTTPPPPNDSPTEPEPILAVIQRIKESRLDPRSLSAEDRRRCVEVLRGEGFSVPEIGQILKRSERTIHRDLVHLRAEHALQIHPQFARQMAGELLQHAEGAIGKLRRIARESTASAMERVIAESSAWKIRSDAVTKLQSLGYLPRVPTGLVAQLLDPSAHEPIEDYRQLALRIDVLEQIDRERGMDDEKRRTIREELKELVQRGVVRTRSSG